MKILKLIFQNLNSLAGKWSIDFTDPAFNEGLFAIIGPTGSGKSTILDAICLAFYGETPRNGVVTKFSNMIMTRKTKECFSEVIFECEGSIYKVNWSQRRSKPRKSKSSSEELEYDCDLWNLCPQEHELSKLADDSDDKYIILESKLSETKKAVAELTGMNSENFMRAVMLAQGSFNAFLKSSTADKAVLLEQILGAVQYSKISTYVFRRTKEEKLKFENLERELQSLKLLTAEERKDLTDKKEDYSLQVQDLEKSLKIKNDQVSKLKNKENLESEYQQLLKSSEELKIENEAFKQKKNKIELGLKAWSVYPYSENYKRLSDELRVNLDRTEKELKQQAQIADKLISIVPERDKLQKEYENARTDYENGKPLIEKVKILDSKIATNKQLLIQSQKLLQASELKLRSYKKQKEKLDAAHNQSTQDFHELVSDDTFDFSHCQDADEIIEKLAEYTEQLWEKSAFISRIHSLDEHRKSLKPDSPCPLCGSLVHPFAAGIPENQTELSEKKAYLKNLTLKAQKIQDEKREYSLKIELVNSGEKEISAQITSVSTDCKNYSDEIESAEKERKQLFGQKDPVEEENKLRLNENKLRNEFDRLNNDLNEFIIKKTAVDSLIKNLKDESLKLEPQKTEAFDTFSAELKKNGFKNQDDFEEALIDHDELKALQTREKFLNEATIRMEEQLSSLSHRLEEAKLITDKFNLRSVIEDEIIEETQTQHQLNRELGRIQLILKEDDDNQILFSSRKNDLDEQHKKTLKWISLNSLIGSADGNKFRIFAQNMMFERVISFANRHLRRIMRRYELVPNKNKFLSLDVKDYNQMGLVRPVENLSGGETFVVCLSLALGLSELSGCKVSVNSLFMDEGFGSLDEKALDKALFALFALRGEGKLIGIISHVPLVQERINTKLTVERIGNGRSKISGPGVTYLGK